MVTSCLGVCLLMRAKADIVKPRDPNFTKIHPRLLGSRFYPHFNNCIGAIDGTHIPVVVPSAKVVQHVGRYGYSTQNVLAICDFDMRFTFVVAGWPGSVHDMRVFNDALRKYATQFPHPPNGKFYLVDSGYPNRSGFLAPYKGTKYHLPEFRNGPRPSGKKEVFAMEGYMHILGADNLDGSEEIWDDPFIRPPEEQTCAVAQGSQPTGGNDEYSQHTKSSKKRTKNFTADEDEKLISAWLNVGLDPIESNNQSMSRYWQRMHAAFHEHKDFESDRSETSLMNRWSIINANVSRFCGVYAQVVRRKQSGLTEQDKIDHAKALYKNGHPKKQSFVMDHCWKKLRHEQKWIQRTDKSQNETTREQAPSGASPLNCSPGSNEQTPNEAMTRPPGKKQEKERQRRGKRPYGDGENHLKEVMSDFWINKKETEDLRELRKKERNDERLQLERERLELQRKDVEMKQRSEDERIINIDISTMSPDQQQFYKMLKDEIFTRRFGDTAAS